jgi:hypothetical protein
VLVGLQFWRAVRDGKHGASRLGGLLALRRSQDSAPRARLRAIAGLTARGASCARVLRLVPATAHSRVLRLRFALPRRCADRLCYCCTAVRSGYDARACASGPPLCSRAQRTDCLGAWAVTPRFQLPALHSVARPSATKAAASPLHCVPFLSLKHRRHAN